MKRCAACVPKSVCSFGAARGGRRWVSSDKSALTQEVLRDRIAGRIREDKYGDEVQINPETKTVSTASGELPMSPLFDPAWIKARRRVKKEEPSIPSGRFRKKLAKNPFGMAAILGLAYQALELFLLTLRSQSSSDSDATMSYNAHKHTTILYARLRSDQEPRDGRCMVGTWLACVYTCATPA